MIRGDITYPTGSWEQLTYAPDTGWLASDLTPFKNSTSSQSNQGNLVQYSYNLVTAGLGDAANAALLVERWR